MNFLVVVTPPSIYQKGLCSCFSCCCNCVLVPFMQACLSDKKCLGVVPIMIFLTTLKHDIIRLLSEAVGIGVSHGEVGWVRGVFTIEGLLGREGLARRESWGRGRRQWSNPVRSVSPK